MKNSTYQWEKPLVNPKILKELHTNVSHSHNWRILIFLTLYVVAADAAFLLSQTITSNWYYLACLPLYVVAAASLHGISLFTHEGVHGVLHQNPHWNRIISIICALPVGQNYSAYKVLHLQHHQHLGLKGDPDHYSNYTKWNWLQFLMHWGRLIIGYPVYLVVIPILGFRQGNAADKIWIVIEVVLLGIVTTALILSPIERDLLISGWLIPMMFINTMVNIRGMSQHTLLEHEFDPILGTRTITTNAVTRFFMCNENYHLEHHLYPGVPWYNLPKLHQELKDELISLQAPFIPSYLSFVCDFVLASFRKSPVGSVVIKK
ncbi:fatty acid desaturase family protein [Calothrix sp. PCC 6303]|uniref:fatty acid desaturase family protein n=1 Tax=Calothrix sp. PCC 6303 TaxID=1170562 RepID=UPI0002A0055B|nr:fatty acid desaturase [Calothrix sp. PCC 6303]AFZ01241.1 fatty acid desaturase [Calothrix sp. PCC 6303]